MLNKVMLIGNLGNDPKVRYTPSGSAVASLSLATARRWKDKDSGERKEATEWHRVILWGKLGEIAGEYLKKGSQIYIEGRLQTRKWQGNDGKDNYTTEIIGEVMHMLGSKGEGAPSAPKQRPATTGTQTPQTKPAYAPDGYDDFDDDIPF